MQENDQLAEQLRSGDKDALKSLYELYGGSVYALALKELDGNTVEALQATADAFVALWEARENMQSIRSVKNFLYASIRMICRKKKE